MHIRTAWAIAVLLAGAGGAGALPAATQPSAHFAIEVVDDQTGRGVPLVELKTVSNVRYYTDSNGLAAIDEPGLVGQTVFFYVTSHGYEFPADGFGFHGARLELTPGGSARLKIKRVNIAERLYRVTGEGIYRDTVMLGRTAPIREPLLNAKVSGQDSVQSAIYRGKIYWFWGDTMRPAYPLGHFGTAGATSQLPGHGGLSPTAGVDLEYFADAEGFSRPMVPHADGTPAWLDGLTVVKDDAGRERLVARVSLMKGLKECVGRRIVVFNDEKAAFDTLAELPLDAPLYPLGHALDVDADGVKYVYFADPWAFIRVKADWPSVKDPKAYEAFTCLAPGARYEKGQTRVERDNQGRLVWGWKADTSPLRHEQVLPMVAAGKIKPDEVWFRPADVETGKAVMLANGTIHYNAFRKRWVMIAQQIFGGPSFAGEIWYAEADHPEGPWPLARRIVTHEHYSLYNPEHHAFFDSDDGRFIYFEGTYAGTFSRESDLTPRYDYNQVMYRLDLSDPRLDAVTAKRTPTKPRD